MPVAASDIKTYLTGAGSDGGAQADPLLSLGNYRGTLITALTATLVGFHTPDVNVLNIVSGGLSFPHSGYLRVDNEIVLYAGRTATAFNGVERGVLSSGRIGHSSGAVVEAFPSLFDVVYGYERYAGDTEYRCICIKNTHASASAANFKIYISLDTGSVEDDISFAIEVPTGGDTNGYAQTVGTESTAPTVNAGNVSAWKDVTTEATGTAININAHDVNLDAGEIIFLWLRRAVSAASTARFNDRILLTFVWDS